MESVIRSLLLLLLLLLLRLVVRCVLESTLLMMHLLVVLIILVPVSSDPHHHHAEDITTFTTRVLEEETGAYGDAALTNGELFQYADPRDYRLDYVYDHFDYVHCDTLGANATAFPHFPRLAWAADAADGGDRRPSDAAGDGGRDARVAEDAAAPGPAAAAVVPNSGQRTGAPGR